MLQKAENNRVKKADKRRNKSDEDLAIYAKEQVQFVKEQEELSKEKSESHYIYVDNQVRKLMWKKLRCKIFNCSAT